MDCSICVQVCPTGIDIRDGLQYQCISCAYCIDACNEVMRKVSRPEGLISFTSESELAGAGRHWLRPRTVGYALAATAMVVAFTVALVSRETLMVEIVRGRGDLYQIESGGQVVNDYVLKLTNKTAQPVVATVALRGAAENASLQLELDDELSLAPRESQLASLRVRDTATGSTMRAGSQPLAFEICHEGIAASTRCAMEPSLFFAPTERGTGVATGGQS